MKITDKVLFIFHVGKEKPASNLGHLSCDRGGNKFTFNTLMFESLPLCKILEFRLCPYIGYSVIWVVIHGPILLQTMRIMS